MGLFDKIAGVIGGNALEKVTNLVDTIVTTSEEKEVLKIELAKELHRHQEEVSKNIKETLEIEFKEMDSARSREVSLNTSEHAGWLSKNVVSLLALGIVVLSFLLFALILFGAIPEGKDNLSFAIVGSLNSAQGLVLAYFFGSSVGSKKKDERLDRLTGR